MKPIPVDPGTNGRLEEPVRFTRCGTCGAIVPLAAAPLPPTALSVAVPCYNEREVLPELHARLSAVCGRLGEDYEIVLVDDGSDDGTWPAMLSLAERDPHLVLATLSRNHGHQLALTAGLSLCRGRRVLIIDADLQDPPELLPEMMRVMDLGADVVYGRRRRRQGEGLIKVATAAAFYRVIERLTDVPIPRDSGDFRLINRRTLDILLSLPERHRFVRGMVSWIGLRQEPFDYERRPRFAGATKYSLRKMVRFSWDAITAFSTKPLTLAVWLGLLTGGVGCALLAYSLAPRAGGGAANGWSSALAAIAIMGSLQLLALGVIGEYLGRMYDQIKGRPLFVIDRVVRSGGAACRSRVGGEDMPAASREAALSGGRSNDLSAG